MAEGQGEQGRRQVERKPNPDNIKSSSIGFDLSSPIIRAKVWTTNHILDKFSDQMDKFTKADFYQNYRHRLVRDLSRVVYDN